MSVMPNKMSAVYDTSVQNIKTKFGSLSYFTANFTNLSSF